MEKLTGHRSWRPHRGCGAPLKSPCGNAGAALATLPPPVLPWLWQLPGTELRTHRVPWAPLAPKAPQQDQAPLWSGLMPQAEQMGACPAPPGCGTKASRAESVFCCSFVCLTVQRAIKTSRTRQSARHEKPRGRRTAKATARPRAAPPVCTDLYLCICRLCCVQLCTERCIGKLQSEGSARKEMKGRCKTGHVQHSETSVPPRCWLSPSRSWGQPGSGEGGGSPAAPGAAGTGREWGQPCPLPGREPGVGHGTFLLRMGGEQRGAQRGPAGWTGHVGPGWKAMGQSREGTAVPPSLEPDGIARMVPTQGHCKGVPSLHRDTAKVSPLPGSAARG